MPPKRTSNNNIIRNIKCLLHGSTFAKPAQLEKHIKEVKDSEAHYLPSSKFEYPKDSSSKAYKEYDDGNCKRLTLFGYQYKEENGVLCCTHPTCQSTAIIKESIVEVSCAHEGHEVKLYYNPITKDNVILDESDPKIRTYMNHRYVECPLKSQRKKNVSKYSGTTEFRCIFRRGDTNNSACNATLYCSEKGEYSINSAEHSCGKGNIIKNFTIHENERRLYYGTENFKKNLIRDGVTTTFKCIYPECDTTGELITPTQLRISGNHEKHTGGKKNSARSIAIDDPKPLANNRVRYDGNEYCLAPLRNNIHQIKYENAYICDFKLDGKRTGCDAYLYKYKDGLWYMSDQKHDHVYEFNKVKLGQRALMAIENPNDMPEPPPTTLDSADDHVITCRVELSNGTMCKEKFHIYNWKNYDAHYRSHQGKERTIEEIERKARNSTKRYQAVIPKPQPVLKKTKIQRDLDHIISDASGSDPAHVSHVQQEAAEDHFYTCDFETSEGKCRVKFKENEKNAFGAHRKWHKQTVVTCYKCKKTFFDSERRRLHAMAEHYRWYSIEQPEQVQESGSEASQNTPIFLRNSQFLTTVPHWNSPVQKTPHEMMRPPTPSYRQQCIDALWAWLKAETGDPRMPRNEVGKHVETARDLWKQFSEIRGKELKSKYSSFVRWDIPSSTVPGFEFEIGIDGETGTFCFNLPHQRDFMYTSLLCSHQDGCLSIAAPDTKGFCKKHSEKYCTYNVRCLVTSVKDANVYFNIQLVSKAGQNEEATHVKKLIKLQLTNRMKAGELHKSWNFSERFTFDIIDFEKFCNGQEQKQQKAHRSLIDLQALVLCGLRNRMVHAKHQSAGCKLSLFLNRRVNIERSALQVDKILMEQGFQIGLFSEQKLREGMQKLGWTSDIINPLVYGFRKEIKDADERNKQLMAKCGGLKKTPKVYLTKVTRGPEGYIGKVADGFDSPCESGPNLNKWEQFRRQHSLTVKDFEKFILTFNPSQKETNQIESVAHLLYVFLDMKGKPTHAPFHILNAMTMYAGGWFENQGLEIMQELSYLHLRRQLQIKAIRGTVHNFDAHPRDFYKPQSALADRVHTRRSPRKLDDTFEIDVKVPDQGTIVTSFDVLESQPLTVENIAAYDAANHKEVIDTRGDGDDDSDGYDDTDEDQPGFHPPTDEQSNWQFGGDLPEQMAPAERVQRLTRSSARNVGTGIDNIQTLSELEQDPSATVLTPELFTEADLVDYGGFYDYDVPEVDLDHYEDDYDSDFGFGPDEDTDSQDQ